MDLYAGLSKSKSGTDPKAKAAVASSLFGLYGDLPSSKDTAPSPAPDQPEDKGKGKGKAQPPPPNSTSTDDIFEDDAPARPAAASTTAGAKSSWGAAKFLKPTFRKRQQPAAAIRPSASQLQAKKQKMLAAAASPKASSDAVATRKVETEVKVVKEEYDPSQPHDYEQVNAVVASLFLLPRLRVLGARLAPLRAARPCRSACRSACRNACRTVQLTARRADLQLLVMRKRQKVIDEQLKRRGAVLPQNCAHPPASNHASWTRRFR